MEAGAGPEDISGTRRNVAVSAGSLTERGLAIADVVKQVAAEIGATPAQVALAWTLRNRSGSRTPCSPAR